MDTDKLAVLLREAYGEFKAAHGVRTKTAAYTRLEGICDGAAALIGCTSFDLQMVVVQARKAYVADEQAGRDKRYRDMLNAGIKELMA